MLKYLNTDITFQEVPDETTLCINITNCPCRCEGCHSSYLAEDVGSELDWEELFALVDKNTGITCVCFMGGDAEPEKVNELAEQLKEYDPDLKVAWYSGRQELNDKINLKYFDFIKLGPYDQNRGGLNKPTTNQVFYEIDHSEERMIDATHKFWKNSEIKDKS